MTRLTTPKAEIDLPQAFRLLGKGPSREELGWVVDRLRESEVEVDYGDELVEIAEANGSSALDALDLAVVRYGGVEALTASGPRARWATPSHPLAPGLGMGTSVARERT